MFKRPFSYLYALVAGQYLVIESLPYGQYARHKRLGRFHSLNHAKAFAAETSKDLDTKVVVTRADSHQKLFVYRPTSQSHHVRPRKFQQPSAV